MTLQEKISSVPKLERIDSSIDSCIKIIEQELNKRKIEALDWDEYIYQMLNTLDNFRNDFEVMKEESKS